MTLLLFHQIWNRSYKCYGNKHVSPCCYFTPFEIITTRTRLTCLPFHNNRRFWGNIYISIYHLFRQSYELMFSAHKQHRASNFTLFWRYLYAGCYRLYLKKFGHAHFSVMTSQIRHNFSIFFGYIWDMYLSIIR